MRNINIAAIIALGLLGCGPSSPHPEADPVDEIDFEPGCEPWIECLADCGHRTATGCIDNCDGVGGTERDAGACWVDWCDDLELACSDGSDKGLHARRELLRLPVAPSGGAMVARLSGSRRHQRELDATHGREHPSNLAGLRRLP